jgi:hypothetical protein
MASGKDRESGGGGVIDEYFFKALKKKSVLSFCIFSAYDLKKNSSFLVETENKKFLLASLRALTFF